MKPTLFEPPEEEEVEPEEEEVEPEEPPPRCTEAHLAAMARYEHADLRLRFALALAPAFAEFATATAQAAALRGEHYPAIARIFDVAEDLAVEHARRCKEDVAR